MRGLNVASNFDLFPPRIALKFSLISLMSSSSNISRWNIDLFFMRQKKDKNKYTCTSEARCDGEVESKRLHRRDYTSDLWATITIKRSFRLLIDLRQMRVSPAKIFGVDELQTSENRRRAARCAEETVQEENGGAAIFPGSWNGKLSAARRSSRSPCCLRTLPQLPLQLSLWFSLASRRLFWRVNMFVMTLKMMYVRLLEGSNGMRLLPQSNIHVMKSSNFVCFNWFAYIDTLLHLFPDKFRKFRRMFVYQK